MLPYQHGFSALYGKLFKQDLVLHLSVLKSSIQTYFLIND